MSKMIDTNNISDEVRTGEGTKHGNNRRTDCQDEWCMKYYHDANRYYKECQKLKFDLHSSNETNRELAAENSKLKKISTNEGLKRELTIAHGKIASLKDSQRKMVETHKHEIEIRDKKIQDNSALFKDATEEVEAAYNDMKKYENSKSSEFGNGAAAIKVDIGTSMETDFTETESSHVGSLRSVSTNSLVSSENLTEFSCDPKNGVESVAGSPIRTKKRKSNKYEDGSSDHLTVFANSPLTGTSRPSHTSKVDNKIHS